MVLGQIVALVMLNKHIKFHKICFSTYQVIVKIIVCHNDEDDNNYTAAKDDDDTRVMTLKNSRAKDYIRMSAMNLTLRKYILFNSFIHVYALKSYMTSGLISKMPLLTPYLTYAISISRSRERLSEK